MNPEAWNLRGYTGFVWGGCAWCIFIWAFFRLPETKGRSFHELDVLFAKKVPARQFASYVVDPYDEQDNNQLAARYSVADQGRKASAFTAVTDFLASHGRAEDAAAQRRGSVVAEGEFRRPSIAPAVTEFLRKSSV